MNIIDRIKEYDIECLSDSLNCIGLNNSISKFKYTVSDKMTVGYAYPISFELCDDKEKCIAADYIDDVEEQSIIVIDNNNIDYCTVWGNILTEVSIIKKINGTIINGAARDITRIKELEYPLYCKHIHCKTGKGIVRLKTICEPVTIDNTTIKKNDIVVAYNSLVLIIPNEKIEEVLEIADKLSKAEDNIINAIKNGYKLKDARSMYKYNDFK